MFPRHPSNDLLKLHQFVFFDILSNFPLLFFKLFVTELCNFACSKQRLFCLSELDIIALKHKKTNSSIETSSKINFEFINFLKCLPLTNQIGNIKCFGNLRFITVFDIFLLPNQTDLLAHCSYHFSTNNIPRLRCSNMMIFLWRFQ